ncbi:AI-2E family transporter [uncultured Nevskia sp.]|uniref:AI-2E family transporter n=1 Tax=uncultured Nevskia sp. TaxID=228950 RepID=UPI0025CC71D3|nr:AI-2E family transporter [uncultured Nevskia sp.]
MKDSAEQPAVDTGAAGTPQNALPVDHDWESRKHIRTLVLMAVTAFGIALCYGLVAPFLPALAWALALAVLFAPLQQRLERVIKHPGLAALLSVALIGLIVVVPGSFVAQQLVVQFAKGAQRIQAETQSGDWQRLIEAQPRLAPLVAWVEQRVDLPGVVETLTSKLTAAAGPFVRGSAYQLIGFCLTFYLLFFLLRDRRAALLALRDLSPLNDAEMNRLLLRVDDTILATVYGTLAVAAVQGLLGGLMFWWLGLPAPLLWGLVMSLLAVVPVLGAFVVWMPAAVFLALEGSPGKALILIGWGMLVVGTIDNLLRPILVGKRLKLHTVLAFVSLVGGLILFGAAGLIVGPVILTVTTGLLEIWSARVAVRPPA